MKWTPMVPVMMMAADRSTLIISFLERICDTDLMKLHATFVKKNHEANEIT